MNEQDILIPPYADPTQPASAVPWWTVSADLLLKLAFVLVVIYVTLWLLRRLMRSGATLPGATLVSVVEQTTLSPGRAVYLLEIGNRLLLVGSTANQISTLAEITDPAEVAELQALRRSEGGVLTTPFAAQLRALVERGGRRTADVDTRAASRFASPERPDGPSQSIGPR